MLSLWYRKSIVDTSLAGSQGEGAAKRFWAFSPLIVKRLELVLWQSKELGRGE